MMLVICLKLEVMLFISLLWIMVYVWIIPATVPPRIILIMIAHTK